jgi:hypothetical protein
MVLRLGNFKMPAVAMETANTQFNTKVNNNHIFSDSITGVVDDGRQLKPFFSCFAY